MNTELRTKAENDFEKVNEQFCFEKTMENVKNHRNIKLLTTDKRRNKLASEPNYYTTKHYSQKFLVIELNKKNVEIVVVTRSVNFKHKQDSHVRVLV